MDLEKYIYENELLISAGSVKSFSEVVDDLVKAGASRSYAESNLSMLLRSGAGVISAKELRSAMEEKTPVQMTVDAINARGEPPRRLSIDPTSPDFDKRCLDIGVRFNSVVRKGDVVAYDADMGWIRIHLKDRLGKPKRERGVFVTMTLKGKVEPFWRDQASLI